MPAPLGGRDWELVASVERSVGDGGVLFASGNENSGLTLFVQDDRLVFDYNCFGEHHAAESTVALPVGASSLGVRFARSGRGATATLVVDGEAVGSVDVPFAMFIMSSIGPSAGATGWHAGCGMRRTSVRRWRSSSRRPGSAQPP